VINTNKQVCTLESGSVNVLLLQCSKSVGGVIIARIGE
jgi:hypothetical protein